jgi:hypothetical protein
MGIAESVRAEGEENRTQVLEASNCFDEATLLVSADLLPGGGCQ